MNTKYQTNKKVLIYCRESRDDYGENYERIETQRDILLEFCQKKGLNNIVDIIMDDNISGTSFQRLDDIKKKMESGEVDIFVCKDSSRLGRNLLESLKFIEFAEEHDVRIIFESEEFNPDLFPLIAWFNERRAKDDSTKIRRVLRHKLENGLVILAPFGYKKEGEAMVPDPNAAPTVEKIFDMAYNGSTPAQISDYLNVIHALSPSEGYSTKRKMVNSIWTRDKVRRILKNPVYTGTQIACKKEKVSYKSKKYKNVPEDQQIVIHNHHEALISEEKFNHVQSRLKSFKISKRNPTFNPFSGILFCGRCGKQIILRSRKDNMPVKYVCSKYNREGNIKNELRENWGCNAHAVYYEDIKKLVTEYISKFIENKSFKNEILKSIDIDEETSKAKDTLKHLCSKKEMLQKRFDILYEDKINGILPDFMFAEKSKPITDEISNIRDRIALLSSEIDRNSSDVPIKRYERCVEELYKNGITSEGITRLFEKIIIYEPFEISQTDKETYSIDDKQYEVLYNKGGILFVQNYPWNSIVL